MKYQRTDRVQSADFSCLEELKCDIIENLLSMIKNKNTDEVFDIINIIIDKEKAFELFEKLFKADVNGFSFDFFETGEEIKLDNLKNQKELLISVSTDGCIWMEKIYPSIYLEAEFFYIDGDINSEWLRKIDDGKNEILIFDIED